MSHSLSLYARCKINGELYRVDLQAKEESSGKFILRPVDLMPYRFLFASAHQLHDQSKFQLFPIFRCQVWK